MIIYIATLPLGKMSRKNQNHEQQLMEKESREADANPGPLQPISLLSNTNIEVGKTTSFISILTSFYQKHNPLKVGEIEKILEEYNGRESEMFAKLALQYKVPNPLEGMTMTRKAATDGSSASSGFRNLGYTSARPPASGFCAKEMVLQFAASCYVRTYSLVTGNHSVYKRGVAVELGWNYRYDSNEGQWEDIKKSNFGRLFSDVSTYIDTRLVRHQLKKKKTIQVPTPPCNVRTYCLVVGDHPLCTNEVAFECAWEYNLKLDLFEDLKDDSCNNRRMSGPQHLRQLSFSERKRLLWDVSGFTKKELIRYLSNFGTSKHKRITSMRKEINNKNPPKKKKAVRFAPSCRVRTYSLVLSDHPRLKNILAIQLGWSYDSIEGQEVILKDEYHHRSRSDKRGTKRAHKRSYSERKRILLDVAGYTRKELLYELARHGAPHECIVAMAKEITNSQKKNSVSTHV